MNWLDIVLIAVLLIGAWRGWVTGLLRQGLVLVGVFVGLLVAFMFYAKVGTLLAPYMGTFRALSHFSAFLLIWILVPVAFGFLASMLTRFFDWIKLGMLNRMAGALVGMVKYAIILSCCLNLLSTVSLLPDAVGGSRLYAPLHGLAAPLIDKAQDAVQTAVHKLQADACPF